MLQQKELYTNKGPVTISLQLNAKLAQCSGFFSSDRRELDGVTVVGNKAEPNMSGT